MKAYIISPDGNVNAVKLSASPARRTDIIGYAEAIRRFIGGFTFYRAGNDHIICCTTLVDDDAPPTAVYKDHTFRGGVIVLRVEDGSPSDVIAADREYCELLIPRKAARR